MNIINIHPEIMWNKDLFLRKDSRELTREEVLSEDFKKIVDFMLQSLYEEPSGVGLAAPQVGLMIRLVVIDIKRNGKNPLVLINPTYTPIDEEKTDSYENCLSFVKKQGIVKRYKKIRVQYKDINFNDVEVIPEGFLTMVFQHEIDHINGIVYIDKTDDIFVVREYSGQLAERAVKRLYEKSE